MVGIFSKKAAINMMILFIAAVLVAGVAAWVLVITANSLQSQSLHAGKQTQKELSTSFEVMDIQAEDGTNPAGSVRYFFVKILPGTGSSGIKLDQLALSVLFQNGSAELSETTTNASLRNCSYTGLEATSGFWTDPSTGRGNFSYTYETLADNHKDGYLQSGDIITLCFMAPYEIPQDFTMGFDFIVRGTFPKNIKAVTPDYINTKRVKVYP